MINLNPGRILPGYRVLAKTILLLLNYTVSRTYQILYRYTVYNIALHVLSDQDTDIDRLIVIVKLMLILIHL